MFFNNIVIAWLSSLILLNIMLLKPVVYRNNTIRIFYSAVISLAYLKQTISPLEIGLYYFVPFAPLKWANEAYKDFTGFYRVAISQDQPAGSAYILSAILSKVSYHNTLRYICFIIVLIIIYLYVIIWFTLYISEQLLYIWCVLLGRRAWTGIRLPGKIGKAKRMPGFRKNHFRSQNNAPIWLSRRYLRLNKR